LPQRLTSDRRNRQRRRIFRRLLGPPVTTEAHTQGVNQIRREYISPSVIDVLGYSPEDYYADPYMALEMVHPDDRQKLKRILHGKGFEERLFLRYIHKDGRVVWIERVAVPGKIPCRAASVGTLAESV